MGGELSASSDSLIEKSSKVRDEAYHVALLSHLIVHRINYFTLLVMF